MVKPAPGKLVLIADSRRNAAWVERSGHAPALIVHSNDDAVGATAPPPPPPPADLRGEGVARRDPYAWWGLAISVAGHVALVGAALLLVPGADVTQPTMTIEIVAEAPGEVTDQDANEAPPEAPVEQTAAAVPTPPVQEPPPPEPAPPEPVAEVPPPPPPPEPEPVPPEPEPPPQLSELPTPEPPPVIEEKPPEPVVEKAPEPPKPRPKPVVKPKPPKPVERPVVVAPPAPVEVPRAEAQETAATKPDAPAEGIAAPAAPAVNDDKVPQPAAAPTQAADVPVLKDADYRRKPAPKFPPRAQDLKQEGVVIVRVLIGVEGEPLEVEIAKSSGFPMLDAEALRATRAAAFTPYTVNGRPMQRLAEFPVNFVNPR